MLSRGVALESAKQAIKTAIALRVDERVQRIFHARFYFLLLSSQKLADELGLVHSRVAARLPAKTN